MWLFLVHHMNTKDCFCLEPSFLGLQGCTYSFALGTVLGDETFCWELLLYRELQDSPVSFSQHDWEKKHFATHWMCVIYFKIKYVMIKIILEKRDKDDKTSRGPFSLNGVLIVESAELTHSQYWYFIWEWRFHSIIAAMAYPLQGKITGDIQSKWNLPFM